MIRHKLKFHASQSASHFCEMWHFLGYFTWRNTTHSNWHLRVVFSPFANQLNWNSSKERAHTVLQACKSVRNVKDQMKYQTVCVCVCRMSLALHQFSVTRKCSLYSSLFFWIKINYRIYTSIFNHNLKIDENEVRRIQKTRCVFVCARVFLTHFYVYFKRRNPAIIRCVQMGKTQQSSADENQRETCETKVYTIKIRIEWFMNNKFRSLDDI